MRPPPQGANCSGGVGALPLLTGYPPGAVLGVSEGREISARAFVAAARALAERLPEAECAMLLCGDRLAFAVGFAALLIRRTAALLPPSHAPQALARIASARKPVFALVDRAGITPGVREIVVNVHAPAVDRADVPQIDGAQVAAIAYTSGTTGEPQPHVKRWDSLVAGATALRERTGFRAGEAMVGAVPPQHMWGLEATVMLPLQAGGILHGSTPLLPEDIAAALADMREPRWLTATPLHMRSCVRSRVRLPSLVAVLTATTPLDRTLAIQFQDRFSATAIEIYGSTETGTIATRRPAGERAFTPLSGVVVALHAQGLAVHGGHIRDEIVLADRAVIEADGRFALSGRDTDLVKVGGKRASLAMLEHELRAIPGVIDGAFALMDQAGAAPIRAAGPSEGANSASSGDVGVVRLAALVVAPGMTPAAVVAALRERVDAVFLPRPLHIVDSLPRGPLGKLPLAEVRARIAALCGSKPRTPARDFVVPAWHPALAGHFPGRPIVPAAWLMVLVADACKAAFGDAALVTRIASARFRAPLLPDTPLHVELGGEPPDRVAFACVAGDVRIADGMVAVGAGR